MDSVTRAIFPVFAFKVTHTVILLTRFCKLLTIVATLSRGGGHVPQVPQRHDASGVVHECETEFGLLPVTDVIDLRKRKFLVKYNLSDNLLCQLCQNCNEIV